MDDALNDAQNDYEKFEDLKKEKMIIFVCATTGQGDQPDNMVKFWRSLLKRTLAKDFLRGISFAVLGLGDSGYAQFNFVAKRLDKRLNLLGASRVLEKGLADDQHDLGQDFVIDPWIRNLCKKLLEMYPLPPDLQPISSNVLQPSKYRIEYMENAMEVDQNGETNQNLSFIMAPLISNQKMTSDGHFQDTRLIEFDIGDKLTFNPGDVCLVQPKNSKENVEKFLSLFNHFDANKPFKLVRNDENVQLPPDYVLKNSGHSTNLRECAERLFDLQAVPGRYFFELLAKFTADETEREKFIEFTTFDGQQDLFDYCNRPRRNSLEVLNDFTIHTVPNIPFEYLFDLFPIVKPRSFSIANSLRYSPNKVQLLVAVVKYKSKLVEPRLGLCSNFLANMTVGETVPIWIKKGTLKLPLDTNLPIIMVGPGTGVAPFRSIIQEEIAKNSKRPLYLVFGNRNEANDFYFHQEWKKMVEFHENFKIFTAFSRDQEDKYYVQHVIKDHIDLFADLIVNQDGFIYIAGNAKQMPDQVQDAFKDAIFSLDESDRKGAESFLKNMIAEKRLQMETWS